MPHKFLIIGAGPTGLGAARRLAELGENDFLTLEANNYAGGLAASFRDSSGFTWDVGGHVVFSHYAYFDNLLDDLLGDQRLTHEREAWVRLAKTWVPYPFQNNVRHLPRPLVWECVRGLLPGNLARPEGFVPANFRQWIDAVFGEGIARLFMLPYNFKVWATPAEHMDYKWIGERVSVVDLARVLKNILLELDDVSWGPNNTFRFPLHGGTGEIYRRMAARLGERVLYGRKVVAVDLQARTVTCSTGERFAYETLLYTGPLDLFVRDLAVNPPDTIRRAADLLRHNGAWIGGVGLEENPGDSKCWMYFPENNCPFYRVTNFHNYSPNNTPDPENGRARKRAIMTEVSFSEHKPDPGPAHLDTVVDGLVQGSLMNEEDRRKVVSTWEMRIDHAYPVPSLERDRALGVVQPWLESHGIYGRGRFGGWKYEVSNMDHCVMQGVEWAQRMLTGKKETTYTL
ncbi:FAD-dependent oxidoreductase [Fundidesulfovibrio butyratiphilus]